MLFSENLLIHLKRLFKEREGVLEFEFRQNLRREDGHEIVRERFEVAWLADEETGGRCLLRLVTFLLR